MIPGDLNDRARHAKALFDFLARWEAPEIVNLSSTAVKNSVIIGADPVVFPMILQKVARYERETLTDLKAYRRTIYSNSIIKDVGYGLKERIFSNVYDTLFAYLAMGVHGADDNYRGQRDCRWKLEASFYRLPGNQLDLDDEKISALEGFYGVLTVPIDEMDSKDLESRLADIGRADTALLVAGLTPIQCEAVIQHYHSGTKLLDFTKSIYVAAFFATLPPVSKQRWTEADIGAIFRIGDSEVERFGMGRVTAPELPERFERIHRQSGVFLRIRLRSAINSPALWSRWMFFHSSVALPFECSALDITKGYLLPTIV
jgi:hypothetical protein